MILFASEYEMAQMSSSGYKSRVSQKKAMVNYDHTAAQEIAWLSSWLLFFHPCLRIAQSDEHI